MRIAITATGRDPDSSLDSRFGRCPCFLLVDPEIQEGSAQPGISGEEVPASRGQWLHTEAYSGRHAGRG